MKRSITRFLSLVGVTVTALGFTSFVTAAESAVDTDVAVSKAQVGYTDLDLRRIDDAGQLYARIERAARQVCAVGYGPSVRSQNAERACIAQSVNDAVQSVGDANLTSVHATRNGKRPMLAYAASR